MTSDSNQPSYLRVSRNITLVGILTVIALLVSGDTQFITKLLLIAPLLIVTPGLVVGWYRSYSWLSLMILVYFIVAVTRVMAPNGNWLDAFYVTITVIVFLTATFSSRWLQQLQHRQLQHQQLQQQSSNTPSNNSVPPNAQ